MLALEEAAVSQELNNNMLSVPNLRVHPLTF